MVSQSRKLLEKEKMCLIEFSPHFYFFFFRRAGAVRAALGGAELLPAFPQGSHLPLSDEALPQGTEFQPYFGTQVTTAPVN